MIRREREKFQRNEIKEEEKFEREKARKQEQKNQTDRQTDISQTLIAMKWPSEFLPAINYPQLSSDLFLGFRRHRMLSEQ